ncbi:helix-turn-helix domain-containing protein [Parafrankia colletiae]|uniref:helix-turn-helix domain-containing protein n=1 Tax=Parafrankia colletiae TaxID=573497 RepID=UPI00389943B1
MWSTEETAEYLGIPVATLYQWRHRHIGPPCYRIGRWLRYDPADIRQWLDTQKAA